MIVLVSSGNNAVIYSGLIAAIVSGVVSLIGYSITAYIQNKSNKEALKVQKKNSNDTIKTQKEIAKMGQKEKLFYESQLEWSNEVRKLITKFIFNCQKLNSLRKNDPNDYISKIKLFYTTNKGEQVFKEFVKFKENEFKLVKTYNQYQPGRKSMDTLYSTENISESKLYHGGTEFL